MPFKTGQLPTTDKNAAPVTEQDFPPPPDPTTDWSDAQLNGPFYSVYDIRHRLEYDSGIMDAYVAGPDGTAVEEIKVYGAVQTKVTEWDVERAGAKPILPHWDTGSTNEKIRTISISPASSELNADGQTRVWRVSGRYVYRMLRPLAEGAALPTGATLEQNKQPELLMIDGIIYDRNVLRVPSSGQIVAG